MARTKQVSDLDLMAEVFDLPPTEQLKRQIIETRRAIVDATASTAKVKFAQIEASLWRELRKVQAEEGETSSKSTGFEEMTPEDVARVVETALKDLPSYLVDRLGTVLDELRQVTPVRLKVLPGGR